MSSPEPSVAIAIVHLQPLARSVAGNGQRRHEPRVGGR